MSSNRFGGIDDEKYWNESTIKGFGFSEENDSVEAEVHEL
jgi:hypothetical protein